ncbi:MAG TPA: VOC family protein [Polyangiaceae bacterium]|nr:VOC family protein [Polyangiaceae bacterium]
MNLESNTGFLHAALAPRHGADPRRPQPAGADEFHHPRATHTEPKNAPPNTLGIGRIMFAVDDIDDVLARLKAHGAELVGESRQRAPATVGHSC